MSDPVKREVVGLLRARAMLKIEVRTGLRHSRGSVLKHVQEKYPMIPAKNKKQAIAGIAKYLKEQHNFDVEEGYFQTNG